VKLLFMSYFLINAADKVDAGHSMQRRISQQEKNAEEESVPSRKFPPIALASIATPSPYPRTSQNTNCLDSTSILGWMKSLVHIYLFRLGLSKLFSDPILLGPWTLHNNCIEFYCFCKK